MGAKRGMQILAVSAVLLISFLAQPVQAEYIILKSGTKIDGEILEYDENRIRFERSSDGRTAWLTWSQLDEDFAEELKAKFFTKRSDVDKEPEIGTVPGVRLILDSGGLLFGVEVVEESDEVNIALRKRASVIKIPRARIAKTESVDIKIHLIYTEEEIYQQVIDEYGTLETADDHLAVAQFCHAIGALEKAIEHYESAAALEVEDEGRARKIAHKAKVLRHVLKSDEIAVAYRRVISAVRFSDNFEKGEEMFQEFALSFPDETELIEQLTTDFAEILGDRLMSKVIYSYYWKLSTEIEQASRRYDDFYECLDHVKETIPDIVADYICRRYGMTAEEFDEFWGNRKANLTRCSTYHGGSFIILHGIVKPKRSSRKTTKRPPGSTYAPGDEKKDSGGESGSSLKKIVTIYGKTVNIGKWWIKYPVWNKVQWLKAYYAECHLHIRKSKLIPCDKCGAKGYKVVISVGAKAGASGERKKTCEKCFGYGRLKTVWYE